MVQLSPHLSNFGTAVANKPVGYNKLDGTVACKTMQECRDTWLSHEPLSSHYHKTRLYRAGVDEQLVMERTGHQSLEGVHGYRRTSTDQQESVSDILNGTSDKCDSIIPRVSTVDIDSTREGCAHVVQVWLYILHYYYYYH